MQFNLLKSITYAHSQNTIKVNAFHRLFFAHSLDDIPFTELFTTLNDMKKMQLHNVTNTHKHAVIKGKRYRIWH